MTEKTSTSQPEKKKKEQKISSVPEANILDEKKISEEKGTLQSQDKTQSLVESQPEEKKIDGPAPKNESKKAKVPVKKKYIAVAQGRSLPISKKQGMYLCRFILNKSIDEAIADIQKVIMFKKVVPFKGEIPHRRGPGIMSGRYPIAASKEFITLLKGLKGNALVNGLELEKTRVYYASTNGASRPARRGGKHAKRAHVTLKVKEFNVLLKEKIRRPENLPSKKEKNKTMHATI